VPTRNIDEAEKIAAREMVKTLDDAQKEIDIFSQRVRRTFEDRRFAVLEKVAGELRDSKELFQDGSWKLKVFHDAFDKPPTGTTRQWQQDFAAYGAWKQEFPDSVTARTAQIGTIVSWAWDARGTKYANETSTNAFAIFHERLKSALVIFEEARALPEKDPCLQLAGMRIALGQAWDAKYFDLLISEALAFDPTFYHILVLRSYSLLPRWHGAPGDWEDFAEETNEILGGLGSETYARIIIARAQDYTSIFVSTRASWPETRKGLMILRDKYPDSFEILSYTAKLATLGNDRKLANECFEKIGNRHCSTVWKNPEHLVHYRTYAQTGKW